MINPRSQRDEENGGQPAIAADGELVARGDRVQTQWRREEGGNGEWFAGTIAWLQPSRDGGMIARIEYDDGEAWTGNLRYVYVLRGEQEDEARPANERGVAEGGKRRRAQLRDALERGDKHQRLPLPLGGARRRETRPKVRQRRRAEAEQRHAPRGRVLRAGGEGEEEQVEQRGEVGAAHDGQIGGRGAARCREAARLPYLDEPYGAFLPVHLDFLGRRERAARRGGAARAGQPA